MSRTRHTRLLLGLGTLGLLGLAAIAAAQADAQALRKQYDMKVNQLAADAGAQAQYDLAKWCLKNKMLAEALSHAVDAHKKAPEDVRAKYLIYVLGGTTLPATGGGTGPQPKAVTEPMAGSRKAPSLSDEEMNAIIKREGIDRIRAFRSIQRLIVAGCGSAKCHGGVGTGAKWVLALEGRADERQLAENFSVVQKYFNRENPAESRFLVVPLTGKEAGHPEKAIRGKTQTIYQRTLEFIDSLKTQADIMWDEADK